jgi:hypothetical protein
MLMRRSLKISGGGEPKSAAVPASKSKDQESKKSREQGKYTI